MADYGLLKTPENMTPQAQELLDRYMQRQKDIDRDRLKGNLRAGLGATLESISALPVFNIPYVGTGLGGALFETGNAIMEGKKSGDVLKDAGKGFLIGETVGAVPYIGKGLSKTKAGQAIGNKASNLFDYLATTKAGQIVAEIAPKVEDVLMTDIKAFNPFKQTQTVYHGSPYDFAKFSNEAIGTGEGAQAHGMGHYAAKSKDVAQKYRQTLSEIPYNEKIQSRLWSDLKNDRIPQLKNNEEKELFEYISGNLQPSEFNTRRLKYYFDDLETPQAKEYADILLNELENNNNQGQLYKLSIPKDDVMLREDLPLSQQPTKVQEAINKIGEYETITPATMYNGELYKHVPRGLFKGWFKANGGGKVDDELANILDNMEYTDKIIKKGNHFDNKMTGNDIYQMLNNDYHNNHPYTQGLRPSDLLNQHGIKGISYNGGIDGEARVIFNPDDIEIVRKYYNQPSLYDFLIKKAPNMGTVVSGIEQ